MQSTQTQAKAGAAIILVESTNRPGSRDMINYRALANKMGFTVLESLSSGDFTVADLKNVRKQLAGDFKYQYADKYDKVIVMIAAHGDDSDQIYDKYGKPYALSELYNASLSDMSGIMEDMTKWFMISCCRGKDATPLAKIMTEPRSANTALWYAAPYDQTSNRNVFPETLVSKF